MQLVINISKEIYERTLPYKDSPIVSNLANDNPELIHAVANGTPLPKGHGDLIDRKELLKQPMDKANYPSNYVKSSPTIIESDIENKREKGTKYCDRNICMLNEYRGIECDKCEVMADRANYIYTGY